MTEVDELQGLRVVVVDDDTIVRAGLAALLPGADVVATYERPAQLLVERPEVELVILDLNLDGVGGGGVPHGATAVRSIAGAGYTVLIYTNEHRRVVLTGCLAAGARGIVHKTESLQALSAAALAVVAGEVVITSALTGLVEIVDRQGQLPSLSPRQRQVLAGRARGEPFARIARNLGISEKVAHEYMRGVSTKFVDYLRTHSPADLERHLGIGTGDLLDAAGDLLG